ncbi:cell division cycle 7-related protein kinase-like isoform X2 [Venturia canescens]|uniref:cell division cycle 7-related protein kinase-like isoform X2 n=1 Tax=Venturia canescens TaxID=32260 RepID=UPI001C9C04D7|nr:cell division cycle 7-related protein kinase-like isoform X2 [Venturia canescens]
MNSIESMKESEKGPDKEKIASLVNSLPILNDLFDIHYKVGEGTFSSVFLATLKLPGEKKKFAIKYLTATYPPSRLERELQCLQEIGGADNVVGVELCLRNAGSVAIVMPYMRHDKFSEYVKDMSVIELKRYMRGLMIAVRKVHKFNIIHRDVKPSNFLYDRIRGKYLLVDFGLAQEYKPHVEQSDDAKSQLPDTQSTKRKRGDENSVKSSLSESKKLVEEKCYCFGKPRICSLCLLRPGQTAPRAGTPGYRAPEILLKYPYQTPAIDIWACGIIMLCILSGTQPFFYCPDDCTALAEITTIFGSTRMTQCARKLGKKLIFSETLPSIDLPSLCQKLQVRNRGSNTLSELEKEQLKHKYPPEAYCLLIRLLDIDHKTRITADQALNHPFLKL